MAAAVWAPSARSAGQCRGCASRASRLSRQLPESTCYVIARPEPLETMRLETTFRWRGDGLIQQNVRQSYNAQAAGEDIDWARRMFAELGFAPDA